jgi:hypothetical protein|tara:strand:+ start:3366 stop:4016 length:651 start_codon:yes stop_codon:yes gene_type:complete
MFLFMEKVKRIALSVLLGSLVVGGVVLICAEASADDLELRVLADVQHQHTDGGVIVLGQEHRLQLEDIRLNKTFTNLGAHYRLTNWLSAGAVYSVVVARDGNAWSLEHRPTADVVVSTSLFSLDLSLRPRVEYRVEGGDSSFRIRKELRVEFSEIPTTPFISDEVFVSTSGDVQRNVISLGLSPLEGLSTFYSLETNFDDVTEYRNIIGVNYRFNP